MTGLLVGVCLGAIGALAYLFAHRMIRKDDQR